MIRNEAMLRYAIGDPLVNMLCDLEGLKVYIMFGTTNKKHPLNAEFIYTLHRLYWRNQCQVAQAAPEKRTLPPNKQRQVTIRVTHYALSLKFWP